MRPDAAIGAPDASPPRLIACADGALPLASIGPTWACTRPDGTRHGPFVTLDPAGSIAVRGAYRDGALDGPWERHHPDGSLAERGAYAAGVKTGPWEQHASTGALLGSYDIVDGTGVETAWLDSGIKAREIEYAGGAVVRRTLFAPDGTEVSSVHWADGKYDGKRVTGTRATVRSEETFKAGLRTGKRTLWLLGHKLVEDHWDADGRLHGAFALYRPGNVIRAQGKHAHGKRVGAWVWFDKFKDIEREGTYVNGRRDGTWTERADGKVSFVGHYAGGKPDGDFIYYGAKGDELGRSTLEAGRGVMKTFHANGRVASETTFAGGVENGPYRERTPRGTLVVEGAYRSGDRHGAWTTWTASGQLLTEAHYAAGKLDGTVKKYVGGTLATEITYAHGKAAGAYVEYRAGVPAVTGQFVDDRRDGTWSFKRADGTTATAHYQAGVLDLQHRLLP